jgi:hypothetical protein
VAGAAGAGAVAGAGAAGAGAGAGKPGQAGQGEGRVCGGANIETCAGGVEGVRGAHRTALPLPG